MWVIALLKSSKNPIVVQNIKKQELDRTGHIDAIPNGVENDKYIHSTTVLKIKVCYLNGSGNLKYK